MKTIDEAILFNMLKSTKDSTPQSMGWKIAFDKMIALLFLINHSIEACTNFWNANLNDPNVEICPIRTLSGEFCKIPFIFEGKEYNH
ncbi:hypothetical protein BpHYR1_009579, partial [Brachionus plicatilis]